MAGATPTGQIRDRTIDQTGQGDSIQNVAPTPAPGPLERLTEEHFKALDPGTSGAFLLWEDASREIKAAYGPQGIPPGLVDAGGNRRIARVVQLPKGFRLFKATQYQETGKRTRSFPNLSPWWSTVKPFQENHHGALELVQTAQDNNVAFRDLVRFISAVSLDWNKLDWYVEIVLRVDLFAFWGQFAPQKSIQKIEDAWAKRLTPKRKPGKPSEFDRVDYGDGQEVYLPDWLGGFGAWQLYIPEFDKRLIEPRPVNLSATNNQELLSYLRSRP